MYADDHNPPHLHAKYNEYFAVLKLDSAEIMEGSLPTKQLRLVQAWIEIHQDELMQNWKETQKELPNIKKISPLK